MNGCKCSGEQVEAVSGEPAEARRLLSRIISPFAILPSRVVPPTLLPHARAFILGLHRLDSADRVDSRERVRGRGRRASRDLQFPRTSEDLVLPLGSPTSSFPIHSFMVPTPRPGSIHSPLTRARVLSPCPACP